MKSRWIIQQFAFILMTLLLSSVSAYSQDKLVLANGEWPPYTSENLEHYGVFSRIVHEAFALEGIAVEYTFSSWARAIENAKSNYDDGTITLFRTAEREKSFYFSDPVIDSRFAFFHLKSYDFDWEVISDLKWLEIGGTNEYNYGEAFQNAEKAGDLLVDRVPSDEMNFQKLLNGRIQIFPMDVLVGYHMLNELFPPEIVSQFTHHPKSVRVDPMHLLLNKKNLANQQRIASFNKGLKRLRESGKLDQYLQKIIK